MTEIDNNKKHQYYLNFISKHQVNDKVVCDICYGSFSYYNKSKHNKTKRHLEAIKAREQQNKEKEENKILKDEELITEFIKIIENNGDKYEFVD